MKIVAAYKWTADPQEAQVAADGRVDLSRARPVVSGYDAVAIEVGSRLAKDGGELVGASVGGPATASPIAVKTALARGLDRTVVVADDAVDGAGTAAAARVLAAVVQHIGDVDVVLTGDCSIDVAARMVPAVLAGVLGWPALTDVTAVEPMADGTLRVERVVPEGVQVLAVQTPAVIAVATDAAVPRVPGMKDVLAAGRKPVEKLDLAALGVEPTELTALAGTVRARAQAERAVRKQHVIDTADPAVAAAELVDTLREAGVW
ncbi:MAG TPA: hypothetical protein VF444_15705 [Pseudonocardiaceae bacterium]